MRQRPFRLEPSGLAGIDAIAASTRHHFPRHFHEQFGIGLIYMGAQKSLSGRGQVEAGAGDVITVNAGEVHDGMPIGDQGRGWRMLYLAPALLADAASDLSEGKTRDYEFAAPVLRRTDLARHFAALYESLTSDAQGSLQQQQDLLLLLAATRYQGKAVQAHIAASASIRHAITLIDDDPCAPLNLDDLAQACGLSRFQTVRGFARATGLTPHAYLLQRRIELARSFIANGAALATAAADSGFADQSHMTRLFTRTYGISPGAYATRAN